MSVLVADVFLLPLVFASTVGAENELVPSVDLVVEGIESESRAFEFMNAVPDVAKGDLVLITRVVADAADSGQDGFELIPVMSGQIHEEFPGRILAIDIKCHHPAGVTNMDRAESDFNRLFHFYDKPRETHEAASNCPHRHLSPSASGWKAGFLGRS